MQFINDQNRKWWILAATTSAASLVFLGQTIINVSLSIIQKKFNASETQVQWIVNSYLLVLASLSMAGGRLCDIIGPKHCFIYGIALFTFSSIACGFADNLQVLIIGRAIQGIGGALLIPANSTICINAFEPYERGKALGIQIGISGIFISLGPFLGGILTEFISWRWVFWINFPFALLAILFAMIALSTPELPRKKESFGIPGLVSISLGLSFLVIGIMQGSEWGWSSWLTYGCLFLGVVFHVAFIYFDRKMENPLVDFSLVKNIYFIFPTFLIFITQGAQIVTIFFAIYIQNVLGYSPFWAGLMMMPATIPQFIMPIIAGKINDRFGPAIPASIGLFLVGFALIWVSLFVTEMQYLSLLPGITLIGFSLSLVTIPSSTTTYNICPKEKLGFVSGIVGTSRLMGSSMSLAITGAILTFTSQMVFSDLLSSHYLSAKLFKGFDPSEILSKNTEVEKIMHSFNPTQEAFIFNSAIDAFDKGFSRSLLWLPVICFISAPIAFFILRKIKPAKSHDSVR